MICFLRGLEFGFISRHRPDLKIDLNKLYQVIPVIPLVFAISFIQLLLDRYTAIGMGTARTSRGFIEIGDGISNRLEKKHPKHIPQKNINSFSSMNPKIPTDAACCRCFFAC